MSGLHIFFFIEVKTVQCHTAISEQGVFSKVTSKGIGAWQISSKIFNVLHRKGSTAASQVHPVSQGTELEAQLILYFRASSCNLPTPQKSPMKKNCSIVSELSAY